jgi:hypothetical protein
MMRKLFTFFALVSLLLGGLTVWWWTGSRNRIDQLALDSGLSLRLWGSGGKVMLTRTVYPPTAAPATGQLSWSSAPLAASDRSASAASSRMALGSFSYARQPIPGQSGAVESSVVLPAWLLTLVFAVLPVAWAGSKFKKSKKSPAHG